MTVNNKAVQAALIARGYLGPGEDDGVIGRKSIAAITKFQKDAGLDIKYPGTIGAKTLAALGLSAGDVLPPWVAEGRRMLGLHETLNNKALRAYLKSDGQTLGDPAKLPWCGDFIQTIIALTLPREVIPINPYWAANWRKFGLPVAKDEFYMGAIGVKARTGGNHVFTIVGHDKTYVHAMGGNQSNSISIVKIAKSAITEMRYPATYPRPDKQMPYSVFNGKLSGSEA